LPFFSAATRYDIFDFLVQLIYPFKMTVILSFLPYYTPKS